MSVTEKNTGARGGRQLLDGYIGVKYAADCIEDVLPPPCVVLGSVFAQCGRILQEHDMTPANGGNMSQRVEDGFVITTSGSNLGILASDELALVHGFDTDEPAVRYSGIRKPSSEAIMHGLIYERFPTAGAVLHAHDEATTSSAAACLPETAKEEPYGTVALAKLAVDAFAAGSTIIVLKNHGYVAIGDDLAAATETVLQTHLRLLG